MIAPDTSLAPHTIGMDGEFLVYDKEGIPLRACDYLEMDGRVGTDGHQETWEMRLEPSRSPRELVVNIGKMLLSLRSHMKEIGVDGIKIDPAPTERISCGSHIWYAARNTSLMSRICDIALAYPIRAKLTYGQLKLRGESGYGRFSDVREQEIVENGAHLAALEYRPCFSFWDTPQHARIIFDIAAMIFNLVARYTNRMGTWRSGTESKGRDLYEIVSRIFSEAQSEINACSSVNVILQSMAKHPNLGELADMIKLWMDTPAILGVNFEAWTEALRGERVAIKTKAKLLPVDIYSQQYVTYRILGFLPSFAGSSERKITRCGRLEVCVERTTQKSDPILRGIEEAEEEDL